MKAQSFPLAPLISTLLTPVGEWLQVKTHTGGKSEASSELRPTEKKSYYPLQYITGQGHTEKLHKIKTKRENKNPKIEFYVYIYEVCIHKIKTNFFFFLKIVFFINMSVLVNKILLKNLNCSSINVRQLGSRFSPKFAVKSKSTDETQLLTWRKKKGKKMKTISPKRWHPVERAKLRMLV